MEFGGLNSSLETREEFLRVTIVRRQIIAERSRKMGFIKNP